MRLISSEKTAVHTLFYHFQEHQSFLEIEAEIVYYFPLPEASFPSLPYRDMVMMWS
jgi:hypothetical protein